MLQDQFITDDVGLPTNYWSIAVTTIAMCEVLMPLAQTTIIQAD